MRPLTILLLFIIFIFSNCAETRPLCKPEKKVRPIKFKGFVTRPTIQATVDFIQKENDSVTVYLKHKRLHNNYGYDYFFARFSKAGFPDSIKRGKILTLYPKINSDSCAYVFQSIKK